MVSMLNFYMIPHSQTYGKWAASALQTTVSMGRGHYCACQLAALVQKFLDDHTFLPVNPYGDWNQTMLIDEDLSNDINLYLQEIGKDISVKKVVNFLAREEVKQKHGITKAISERTACWYLNALGYQFCTAKKGQYADGHEHKDIVYYRDHTFLPQWKALEAQMENWSKRMRRNMVHSLVEKQSYLG